MNDLFDIAPDRPSRRVRLSEFKRKHGILTHCAKHMDEPWSACLPLDGDKGKAMAEIMSESCRLYDDSGRVVTADGELSAIRKLCAVNGIRCDL
jgi:hypothetical protein